MLNFTLTADLETSGFFIAAVVVDVFLANAAVGGRLISFLTGAVALSFCAAVVLPEEGAVATLEVAVLAEQAGLIMAAEVEALAAGWEVGAVAGLDVFKGAAVAVGFVVEEVPDFEAEGPVGRLSGAVVLGLGAASVFFGMPFAGLVPLVTAAEAEAGPVGFLSGILT